MQTASFIPPQGTSQDLGERLVSYLRAEDPSLVKPLQPARQEDIQRYLSLARPPHNQAMPLAWLSYVEHFGQCAGVLFLSMKIETDVPYLIDYYEDDLKYNPDCIDLDEPLVGNLNEVGVPLVMDLHEEHTNDAEIVGFSESWENMTTKAAFSGRLARSHHTFSQSFSASGVDIEGAIGPDGDVFRVWTNYCNHSGIQSLWFSDRYYLAGRSESGLIEMHLRGPRKGLFMRVYSSSPAEVENIKVRLAGALGAT